MTEKSSQMNFSIQEFQSKSHDDSPSLQWDHSARTNNEMKLLALHGSHKCICADFCCLLSVLMIVIVISDYCTSCKEDLQKPRHVREEGSERSKRSCSLLQQVTRLQWDTAWMGYQILLRVDFKSPLPLPITNVFVLCLPPGTIPISQQLSLCVTCYKYQQFTHTCKRWKKFR